VKYLSPLLLFGLNGVVILNGVAGGTRSAVFFSVLLGKTLTPPAGWTQPWCWAVPCWRNSYIRTSSKSDLPFLSHAKSKTSG
jgi:hypothetical protein